MQQSELISMLFRQEFSKMVAVISAIFGLERIELAEDLVSDTFLTATESWQQKGVPANPTAWLYHVAKQKTLYQLRRNKILQGKILPELKQTQQAQYEMDFSEEHIRDSQLRMIFAVCDPILASEAQIALALRVLCGFSIDEIAEAFFANKETINKRLVRAREKFRTAGIRLEMPPDKDLDVRLDNVLHIIYLLFSEGYYSGTHQYSLRKDLSFEALHLALLLTEYPTTDQPKTNALIALICFHSSRFDARNGADSQLTMYENQDSSLWNQELIDRGRHYLARSAHGTELSSYHLEAGIAYWHCEQEDTEEKWNNILEHYDLLAKINNSPSVALNRAYALYKVKGKAAAIEEIEPLQWTTNHFYFTLLGELYRGLDDRKARQHLETARALAHTEAEKQIIGRKLQTFE